ncbi:hypothetical protein [Pararhodobacter sp. SW119]|uniref:RSP_7527 family protein n=1 Tax=Pararhodobacter sp. SW119 TaxID=2780075 RepID=UPI001AE0D01E|nr:hypothetical protein [Pararhodobacter sp. SW119]
MNRKDAFHGEIHHYDVVDVVAIERQARAMQAEVMAGLIRSGWNWLANRLRRAPAGHAA